MAILSYNFTSLSVLLLLFLINPLVSCDYADYSLYVFGDSLFDPGNALALDRSGYVKTGSLPYGNILLKPTGSFSDGLNIIDFLAGYLKIPSPQPYYQFSRPISTENFKHGANFATYGAGVLGKHRKFSKSLDEQYGDFRKLFETTVKKFTAEEEYSKTAFVFSIGRQDYIHQNRSVDDVISKISKVVEGIYNIYGGKNFVFQNLGPLGCLPYEKVKTNKTDICDSDLLKKAKEHNEKLRDVIEELKNSRLYKLEYAIFDYYSVVLDRIERPQVYGLKETCEACCGSGKLKAVDCVTKDRFGCENPSEFLFWDGAHVTHKVNNELALLMWNGNNTYVYPQNVRELFAHFDPMD